MPWKETCVIDQRRAFIEDLLRGDDSIKELCCQYGISEKTGHKWRNRFMESGMRGLCDTSRAPHSSPTQLAEDTVIRVIRLREAHPRWGPKKLAVVYQNAYPEVEPPSVSSIHRVLDKAELIKKRRHRNTTNSGAASMRRGISAKQPNDVWTADYKGWWYSSGQKCLPFTVRDLATKNIFDVRLMDKATAEAAKELLRRLFCEYGMPEAFRTDNGIPFAAHNSLLGLTTLSAWLMYHGIIPDRIDPGTPTQNGSHERMHGDIRREIQGRIPGGIAANQAALDAWVEEYNTIRPHETLGMKTPASLYTRSPRIYQGDDFEWEYPFGFETRITSNRGCIRIRKTRYFLTEALKGMIVRVEQINDDHYTIWLGEFPIAILDTQLAIVQPTDILQQRKKQPAEGTTDLPMS